MLGTPRTVARASSATHLAMLGRFPGIIAFQLPPADRRGATFALWDGRRVNTADDAWHEASAVLLFALPHAGG